MSEKYRVIVQLKSGVLDVQGKAIESSLGELGVDTVSDVRVGRVVEFSASSGDDEIKKLCDELFSNPVIEDYTIEKIASEKIASERITS